MVLRDERELTTDRVTSRRSRLVCLAFAWGVLTACSAQVTSETTSNSLVPEEPTSTQSAIQPDGGISRETSSGASTLVSTATSAVETSGAVTDETAPPTASPPSTDAGVDTTTSGSIDSVDGELPSYSPRTDEACGIAVGNGPPLCDPVAQCGCGTSQTCAYTPERARVFTCVAPGSVEPGGACDTDDACTAGHVCVSGLCAATCRYDEDCAEGACGPVRRDDLVVSDIRVCFQHCSPLAGDECGSGAICANAPGSDVFTCTRQQADQGESQSCKDSRDCAAGLGCAPDGVCRSWCSLQTTVTVGSEDAGLELGAGLSTTSTCPTFSECVPFSRAAGIGLCGATCPVPQIAGSECSVFAPTCGCSAEETCQVELNGRTACNAPGQQSSMGWCNSNKDCGSGLSCIGGLCRPVCDPELAPCTDGSGCIQASTAADAPSACLGHCDPVHPSLDDDEFTPCGSGGYCSPGIANNDNLLESYCTRQNDIAVKDDASCTADYECRSGSGCDPQTKTCRPWCRGAQDCASGASCALGLSPARTSSADETVGFCRTAP